MSRMDAAGDRLEVRPLQASRLQLPEIAGTPFLVGRERPPLPQEGAPRRLPDGVRDIEVLPRQRPRVSESISAQERPIGVEADHAEPLAGGPLGDGPRRARGVTVEELGGIWWSIIFFKDP